MSSKQDVINMLLRTHLMNSRQHLLQDRYNVSSISQLTSAQLEDLMNYLKSVELLQKNDDQIKKLRSSCLRAMSRFMDSNDWEKVNEFMMNKRIAGKLLYELTEEELKNLHRKINKIADIIASREKQIKKLATQN